MGPQKDIQMIEKAKDLNAKYIRFDVWWKDVEPMDKRNFVILDDVKRIAKDALAHRIIQGDQFNENAFAYYVGVCKSDLPPKLGYNDLKYQFSLFEG